MSHAEALASTAVHAAVGKRTAVRQGYWQDSFAHHFTAGSELLSSPNPLIDRGQYARVAAIASMTEQFLSATALQGRDAQIVSLGAGFDTRFWQLAAAGVAPRLYVELDQDEVVRRKCALLRSQPSLLGAVQPTGAADCVHEDGVKESTTGYWLLSADLNDTAAMGAALETAGWRADEPTLIVAECLLVYMEAEASRAIVAWFGARVRGGGAFVAYEMCGPHDPFGRMMVDNLRRRGCPLLGLKSVPDARAQERRCLESGWQRAEATEMLAYFNNVVGDAERGRVCKIALLDELEEWRLLLSHYCVVLAVKDPEATEPAGAVAPAGGVEPAGGALAGLTLQAPVTRPPLVGLGVGAEPPAATGHHEPPPHGLAVPISADDAADPGQAVTTATVGATGEASPPLRLPTKPPPLNADGQVFREEDEAEVWSDDDDDAPPAEPPYA